MKAKGALVAHVFGMTSDICPLVESANTERQKGVLKCPQERYP
jgi:hypothetical protein